MSTFVSSDGPEVVHIVDATDFDGDRSTKALQTNQGV
jgi:hypothetical protein